MADPIENKLVDKRVAQRYLRKGKLADKQYDGYLEALPDLADQAVPVEASMGGGDEPDDLDEVEEETEAVEGGEAPPTQP